METNLKPLKRGRQKGFTKAKKGDAARLRWKGKSNKQIAEELGVSPRTVTRYLRRRVTKSKAASISQPPAERKGNVKIWCGDCLQLMKRIADESIDVICTSPPFNRGIDYDVYGDDLEPEVYDRWMDGLFDEFARILKPTGSFFLIVGHSSDEPTYAFSMGAYGHNRFCMQNQIVWVKSLTVEGTSRGHFTPFNGDKYLNRNWDFVFHFSKNGPTVIDRQAVGVPYVDPNNIERYGNTSGVRCAGDVWFVPFETINGFYDRGYHPATFPPELSERCFKLAGCNQDSIVLDPFCGVNGMVAANKLGLNGIGIDISPTYCQIAAERSGGTIETAFI